jgi:hypothetical protein
VQSRNSVLSLELLLLQQAALDQLHVQKLFAVACESLGAAAFAQQDQRSQVNLLLLGWTLYYQIRICLNLPADLVAGRKHKDPPSIASSVSSP